MNIKDFSYKFHDGGIIDIRQVQSKLEIWMESFPFGLEEIDVDSALSERRTLRGKLVFQNIKKIAIEHKPIEQLNKDYDDYEILDLIFEDEKVTLFVIERDFPPKKPLIQTEMIEIVAEIVYWENLPTLLIENEKKIDLDLYKPFFQNSKFICFEYKNEILKVSIESRYITPADTNDQELLYYNAIRGKLMMKDLKYSKKNGQDFQCPKEEFRLGKILNFEIENTKVSMKVHWQDSSETDYFEFEAGEIFFLSIPLLYDPFES